MSTLKANNIQHLDATSANIQTTPGGGTIITGVSTIGNESLVVESSDTERLRIETNGELVSTNGTLRREVDTSSFTFTGGTASNSGANITVYGDSHDSLANVFRVRVAASEKVRVSAGGSMGIGTNDPQCLLHLEGNKSSATKAKIILADNASGNGDFYFESAGSGSENHLVIGEGSDPMILVVGDVAGGGTGTRGYVGINTTIPRETVSIAGTIRVENTTNSDERLLITHQGIDFQNTGAGSSTGATSHLLDDYEEGTWTPTFYGASTAGTYTLNASTSQYAKIGNIVHLVIDIKNITTVSAGTGGVRIGGLPFTPSNGNEAGAIILEDFNYPSTSTYAVVRANSGNFISLVGIRPGQGDIQFSVTDKQTNVADIFGSLSYFV